MGGVLAELVFLEKMEPTMLIQFAEKPFFSMYYAAKN